MAGLVVFFLRTLLCFVFVVGGVCVCVFVLAARRGKKQDANVFHPWAPCAPSPSSTPFLLLFLLLLLLMLLLLLLLLPPFSLAPPMPVPVTNGRPAGVR